MLSLGTVLKERYRVDRLLEIGALEGQYGGWDLQAGAPVLIKEMTPQPDLDPETLLLLEADFERDAAALAGLKHPNIVRVLDHFCEPTEDPSGMSMDAANAYLILEATTGQTLMDLIAREGAIKEGPVVAWAGQVLAALTYAHAQGICHRDIKPDNILIMPDNRAMLTNFEILALWNPNDPRTWTAKRVMGTPEYAPPERWGMRTTHIDPRSDIYSLGATLYHALTGERPLTAGERTANPYQFLQVKALSPRVSTHTQAVILKAMVLPRDKRYQSAQEMAEALNVDAEQAAALTQVQPPAIFLPRKQRGFSWARVLGLLASTLVLFVAGIVGLGLADRFGTESPSRAVDPDAGAPTRSALSTPVSELGTAAEILIEATPAVASPEIRDTVTATSTTSVASPEPNPTAVLVTAAPSPPPSWQTVLEDGFNDNDSGWIVSEYEDDWGTTTRNISNGVYEWVIDAGQPVGRWCTPELDGQGAVVGDFFVSVEAQRTSGPEAAAYGLVLRHTEGSYYLFSVRDDGFYQFSLWSGVDWQTMVDWTQTLLVNAGQVNSLAVLARDGEFEFFINDEAVDRVQDDQLTEGEVGLSISTAATDGEARFVFDNFRLWQP